MQEYYWKIGKKTTFGGQNIESRIIVKWNFFKGCEYIKGLKT